ncbi:MAG TPA: apolipoprotein N-acyltransferase [Terracidiphilus sp.]|nr:apolipoprotein N-acyltransferase [Terracidiphilus sp.]
MQRHSWRLWAAAVLSAGLLELPFPLAGPMPPWRSIFAWFGLVPLLWALLHPSVAGGRKPLRRAFLISYLCGFLWYCGNCYWVYHTMLMYGDLGPLTAALLLVLFSLVLGLYFGFFALCLALISRAKGTMWALIAAPFLWVALELAAARITSVPWDQLGYSQVDNSFAYHLAPTTGVYGISWLLVVINVLLAQLLLGGSGRSKLLSALGLLGPLALVAFREQPPQPAPTATAVLIQPNLDVGADLNWPDGEWNEHMAQFQQFAGQTCKSYIQGIPQTGAPTVAPPCPTPPVRPDLVVWPEAPAPFEEEDKHFREALAGIAQSVDAPLVVGSIGMDYTDQAQAWHDYNSALVIGADGRRVGRYDKIHLVPFGEYVPFEKLLFFARKLTGRVSRFDRGQMRKVFLLGGHRYGVFICYEAVFADEVRHFAGLGAEVLVNISDDGWYGDTSAPWQHLNMARMRAIENRRWLLRDTNTGVTAVIDPYGRVRQSIPRHQADALPARLGFRDDITFYTAHGDVFAWACAILAIGAVGWSVTSLKSHPAPNVQEKVRS